MWADSEEVGFGIRGDTVVAWYCKGGNSPRTISNFRQNVNPVCITGTKGSTRWYECYNKGARERHNRYRIIHGVETTGFTVDAPAAQALQKMLDEGNSMASRLDRPPQYQNCGQNKFDGTDAFGVRQSHEATDAWYGGKEQYNFAGGVPKSAA